MHSTTRRRALTAGAAALTTAMSPMQKRVSVGNGNGNLKQGLVAYYKFDEGFGVTTRDSSPSGLTPIFAGSPTWTSGIYGNAISLNGTNQYLTLPNGLPFLESVSFTISAWVYVKAFGYAIISCNNTTFASSPTSYNNYLYVGTDGNLRGGLYHAQLVSVSAVSLNNWIHVAFSFNKQTNLIKLYQNGLATASSASSNIYVGTPSYWAIGIGKATSWPDMNITNGTSSFFNGVLDEVRFYSRCLAAQEIAQLCHFYPDEGQ